MQSASSPRWSAPACSGSTLKTMAELTKIEFLPRKGVIDLRMAVEECNRENTADGDERRMAIPDIEKAETLEALGISEFYDGDYASAAEHLDLSLAFRIPQGRRSSRRLCIAYTFVSAPRFLCNLPLPPSVILFSHSSSLRNPSSSLVLLSCSLDWRDFAWGT